MKVTAEYKLHKKLNNIIIISIFIKNIYFLQFKNLVFLVNIVFLD